MDELLKRIDDELRLTREQHADYLREMREFRQGYGVAVSQMHRVLQDNSEAIRENSEVIRENREAFRENRAAMREMREEIRANTKAILALLDRFENGGASPATG